MFIKLTVLAGISFVGISYFRIKKLNREIEKYHNDFEHKRKFAITDEQILCGLSDGEKRKQEERKKELYEERDLKIGHLQRKRDSILSMLPFLK